MDENLLLKRLSTDEVFRISSSEETPSTPLKFLLPKKTLLFSNRLRKVIRSLVRNFRRNLVLKKKDLPENMETSIFNVLVLVAVVALFAYFLTKSTPPPPPPPPEPAPELDYPNEDVEIIDYAPEEYVN